MSERERETDRQRERDREREREREIVASINDREMNRSMENFNKSPLTLNRSSARFDDPSSSQTHVRKKENSKQEGSLQYQHEQTRQ